MPRLLTTIALLLALSSASFLAIPGQAADDSKPLTNDDIISLVKVGLSDAAVIAAIQKSERNFDLAPSELVRLKRAGVSNAVVEAMLGIGKTSGPNQAPTVSDLPTVYGYYALVEGKWTPVSTSAIQYKYGIALLNNPGIVGSYGVQGLSGSPSVKLDNKSAMLLVYQQNIDVATLRLSRLEFVQTMQAFEFNINKTSPELFSSNWRRGYNDVIPIEL